MSATISTILVMIAIDEPTAISIKPLIRSIFLFSSNSLIDFFFLFFSLCFLPINHFTPFCALHVSFLFSPFYIYYIPNLVYLQAFFIFFLKIIYIQSLNLQLFGGGASQTQILSLKDNTRKRFLCVTLFFRKR